MSSRGPIAAYRRLLAILVAVLLGCLATSHAAIAQTAAKPATQPPAPVVTPAPDVTPTPTAPPLSAPTAAPPPAAAREPAKPAQPRLARAIADPLKKLSEDVDSVSGRVEDAAENEDELNTLRSKLDELLAVAKELEQKIKAPLADVKSQIDKLGPAPGKDAAPESPQVAAERKRLGVYFSQLDGAAKTVKLAEEQIGQLVGRIQELRRALFTQALLKRTRSPLRPAVWSDMIEHSGTTMRLIGIVLKAWWLEIQPHLIEVILLLVASLLTLFGLKRLVKRLIRWVRGGDQPRERTQLARANAVVWTAPARAIPMLASLLLLYAGLDSLELLKPPIGDVVQVILQAALLFIAISALSRTLFSPNKPLWRVLPLDTPSANRLHFLIRAIAAVYAVDMVFREMNRAFYAPLSLTVAETFVSSIAFAMLLLAVVFTPFKRPPASEAEQAAELAEETAAPTFVAAMSPRSLKFPLLAIALVIIVVSAAGYVALGRFIAGQVVVTGSILVAAMLLHLAIRGLTREIADSERSLGHRLEDDLGLDTRRRGQLALALSLTLNALLVLAVVPVLLLQWGVAWADIQVWLRALIFGFEIGSIRISLARILIAGLLFTSILFATRVLQRSLGDTVLHPSRMDTGIANSIGTAVGYLGIAVAAAVAIAYAGFDITNLAIVAGALSVGIGFGLQSIVNNFVSGLILLVERPIKVGDWIVVGNDQGFVRRISVRATEIETFDRSSLILPNSELITGRVINLTHRNAMGRVIINVGTAYSSDPAEVVALLREIAQAHPTVLRHPEPRIAFVDFGASSLDFSVRVYIPDIKRTFDVQTDLRIAIFKAFAERGIEIPFPQQDLHLRDLDGLKQALAKVLAERQGGTAPKDVTEPPPKPA